MAFALRVSLLLSLVLVCPRRRSDPHVHRVHDCTHGSFMRSRRANDVLGVPWFARMAALSRLAAEHAVHHATAEISPPRMRGHHDAHVSEYQALRWGASRTGSSAIRSSCSALAGSSCSLKPRFVPGGSKPRVRNSVLCDQPRARAIVAASCLASAGATICCAGPGVCRHRRSRSGCSMCNTSSKTPTGGHPDWRYDHAALEELIFEVAGRARFFTGNIASTTCIT